jgi:hypothetical protein
MYTIVMDATTCGDALPDPVNPFRVTTGTNEVWFRRLILAARPKGEAR